jgi:hypothetical protein
MAAAAALGWNEGSASSNQIGATGEIGAAAAATRLSHARVVPYPMEQVWPTALRYLRVDRGYTLVDRDAEAGYVLFDFPIGDGSAAAGSVGNGEGEEVRVGRGSLELLATVDASGRPSVKLQVSTDAGPTHLPHAIADGLATKLKTERGQPAPAPPRTPGPTQPKPSPGPAPDEPDDGSLPTLPPAVDPSELSGH